LRKISGIDEQQSAESTHQRGKKYQQAKNKATHTFLPDGNYGSRFVQN
jgi:hypothetical protein